MRRKFISLAAIVALFVAPAACGSGDDDDDQPPATTTTTTTAGPTTSAGQTTTTQDNGESTVTVTTEPDPTPVTCEVSWNTRPETVPLQASSAVGWLDRSRPGQHPCFDRVTFDFGNQAGTAGPGSFEVSYVDQVTSDGSGEPVSLDGQAFLQVTVRTMEPPIDADIPNAVDHQVSWQALREVKFGGFYEGVYVLGIGVSQKLPFRVGRDSEGSVFVDIAHPE